VIFFPRKSPPFCNEVANRSRPIFNRGISNNENNIVLRYGGEANFACVAEIFFWLKRQGLTQSLKFLYYIILLVSAFDN